MNRQQAGFSLLQQIWPDDFNAIRHAGAVCTGRDVQARQEPGRGQRLQQHAKALDGWWIRWSSRDLSGEASPLKALACCWPAQNKAAGPLPALRLEIETDELRRLGLVLRRVPKQGWYIKWVLAQQHLEPPQKQTKFETAEWWRELGGTSDHGLWQQFKEKLRIVLITHARPPQEEAQSKLSILRNDRRSQNWNVI